MKNQFSTLAFQAEIMKRTSKALHSLQESKTLKHKSNPVGQATYREALIENKMINDGNFLLSLGKKFLGENTEDFRTYLGVVTECINFFNKVHMEVDIQPRLISPALNYDKTLNESTKLEIYKNHFTESLTKAFSQPLLEGRLYQTYEAETKLLLENIVQSEILDIDVEAFTKYALFESSLNDTMMNIILPDYSRNEINKFISAQSPEYFEMFQENAQVLLDQLTESVSKLAIAIGPNMFNESVGLGIGLKDLEKSEIGAADNVGPIGDGKILNVDAGATQVETTFDPVVKISDDGMGMNNDGINNASPEFDDAPSPDQNVENNLALDSELEDVNTSTNEPEGGVTPEVEIGKEYNPADKIPETKDDTITIDQALEAEMAAKQTPDATEVDQATFVEALVDTEDTPEEYISIPVSESYVEESTNLDEADGASCEPAFSFRQYAGAMNIITSKK